MRLLRIMATLCLAIMLAVPVFALDYRGAKCSGEQTSDQKIYGANCLLTGVLIITDGTNSAKVVVKDSTTATGTVVAEFTVAGSSYFGGGTWEVPVEMHSGIYCDVTGTGASYVVYFIPLP